MRRQPPPRVVVRGGGRKFCRLMLWPHYGSTMVLPYTIASRADIRSATTDRSGCVSRASSSPSSSLVEVLARCHPRRPRHSGGSATLARYQDTSHSTYVLHGATRKLSGVIQRFSQMRHRAIQPILAPQPTRTVSTTLLCSNDLNWVLLPANEYSAETDASVPHDVDSRAQPHFNIRIRLGARLLMSVPITTV
jgi:hypothetical protein